MGVAGWPVKARSYQPILAITFSSFTSFALIALYHRSALRLDEHSWSSSLFAWFLLGIAYTHFFEYGYHRFLMHARAGWPGFINRNHLRHHQVFYGDNFTSRDREDWQFIASPWFVFPTLLLVHYAILRAFLPPRDLVVFFGGVLLHYLVFEWSHWLTHVEGNVIDCLIGRIPVLRTARSYHIRHHQSHHEIPTANFNFNPPFLGDWLCGTLRVPPRRPAPDGQAIRLETDLSR